MEAIERIELLFARYQNKTITSNEFDELLIWLYGMSEEQGERLASSQKELWEKARTGQLDSTTHLVNWNAMLEQVLDSGKIIFEVKPVRRLWPRIAAAAAVILLLGTGTFFLLNNKRTTTTIAEDKPVQRLPENVLPITNQTVLILPNDKQIILDSAANGNLTAQIIKLQNGEITYNNISIDQEPEYHTISVPRGGRPYQLQLADGSKIWLNAASSLRYPSFFKGDNRTVEIIGEGYFEVSKNASMPFHVKYDNMDVEVLGTHFNVMAYKDESNVQTTLLEGSVNVNKTAIKPGQQAQFSGPDNIKVVNTNTDLAVAWTKGYFQFDKADVKTILRQVSRWYDLDIEYRGNVSADLFSGKIERNLPLTGIVKLLSGINMKVEGNKLIVQ